MSAGRSVALLLTGLLAVRASAAPSTGPGASDGTVARVEPRTAASACDPIVARATLSAADAKAPPDDALATCVARDAEAPTLLRAALDGQPGHAGLSRALALSLLAQPELAWTAEDVAHLTPGDKRLAGDGLRARRGRATPVLEHARTFARAGWYRPVPNWTPALLTDVDRTNIRLLESPPAPVAKVVAPETLPPPPPMAVEPPGLCGCASTHEAAAGTLLLLALVACCSRWSRRSRSAAGANKEPRRGTGGARWWT
jgi:hypothetical protein